MASGTFQSARRGAAAKTAASKSGPAKHEVVKTVSVKPAHSPAGQHKVEAKVAIAPAKSADPVVPKTEAPVAAIAGESAPAAGPADKTASEESPAEGKWHGRDPFLSPVVSNGMNKAYFLRENDPVFNGYVVKITGDSIVFQETVQDRLGKTFTREVTKKITTPSV